MRPLIYFCASSLDGFIAGPNDEIDWLFTDGDYGFKEFFDSIDTIITGRRTWDITKSFGDTYYKDKKVVVFSRKGLEVIGGIHNRFNGLGTDPAAVTKEILKQEGAPVWLLGGGDIAGQLAKTGLISNLVISIHPILIGEGIPLFKGLNKHIKFKVTGSETFPSGLVQIRYRVT